MSDEIVMYGSPTCPMVPPVRGMLRRAQAPFQYVDISRDGEGRARVLEINNGYASVPTLEFPDGSTLTEPSTEALNRKLKKLGYQVPPPTMWQSLTENPFYSLLGTAALLFGLIDGNGVFIAIGVGILLLLLLKGIFSK